MRIAFLSLLAALLAGCQPVPEGVIFLSGVTRQEGTSVRVVTFHEESDGIFTLRQESTEEFGEDGLRSYLVADAFDEHEPDVDRDDFEADPSTPWVVINTLRDGVASAGFLDMEFCTVGPVAVSAVVARDGAEEPQHVTEVVAQVCSGDVVEIAVPSPPGHNESD